MADCKIDGTLYGLMLKRTTLFGAWAAIGFVCGFEMLYLFTPLGWGPLVLTLLATWQLRRRGFDQAPEAWGLLAGAGLFAIWIGSTVDEPGVWIAAGAGFVAVALLGFAWSGRARCAHQA